MTYILPKDRPKPATNKGKRLKRKKVVYVEAVDRQQELHNINCPYAIAIDPDTKLSGFAALRRSDNTFTFLLTLDFFDVMQFVKKFNKQDVVIYIELPKTTVNWHQETEGAENWSVASRQGSQNATSVKVGCNRGFAMAFYNVFCRAGYTTYYIQPLLLDTDSKGKKVKCNDTRFREITGYDGPVTNPEKRDAALLAWYKR